MSEKTATIRADLKDGGVSRGLRKMVQGFKGAGRQISTSMKASFKEGFKGAKRGFEGLAKDSAGLMKTAATLGGAFTVVGLAKQAIELQQKYRDLAVSIGSATGEAVRWQDVQDTIQGAAEKTNRTSEEMAAAFDTINKATQNAEFAAAALIPIGQHATASGKDVLLLADSVQVLQRKFNLAAKDIPGALSVIESKVDQGGELLESLPAKLDQLSAAAVGVGFEGEKGFSQLLGLLQALDSKTYDATAGLRQMFEQVADGTTNVESFKKATGIKFEVDDSALDRMRKALAAGKGDKFQQAFAGGGAGPVFRELSEPFKQAFKIAKNSGLTTKLATEAGLKAFDAQVRELTATSRDWESIQKLAKDRADSDPAAKFREAQERLLKAFTSEEMLGALERLAQQLPKVADGLAKLVTFVLDNPYLSGAGFVGAKVGGSALSASIASVWGDATKGVGKSAASQGKKVAESISQAVAKQGFGNVAVKSMAVAGGITAAAIAGVAIGTALAEEVGDDFDAAGKGANWLMPAVSDAQTDIEMGRDLQPAVERLENALRMSEQIRSKEELFLGLTPGDLASLLFSPAGLMLKRAAEDNLSSESEARQMLETVKATIEAQKNSGKDASDAVAELATSSREAARALTMIGPPATNGKAGHGLRAPAPVIPIGPKL
jgi:hypothetical protein